MWKKERERRRDRERERGKVELNEKHLRGMERNHIIKLVIKKSLSPS